VTYISLRWGIRVPGFPPSPDDPDLWAWVWAYGEMPSGTIIRGALAARAVLNPQEYHIWELRREVAEPDVALPATVPFYENEAHRAAESCCAMGVCG